MRKREVSGNQDEDKQSNDNIGMRHFLRLKIKLIFTFPFNFFEGPLSSLRYLTYLHLFLKISTKFSFVIPIGGHR